ncbi:MAG: D-glycero-beta-D-manno-heptose 1-phosphate adenylyltransferase [Epsilonproteobacteria bacterium]|nr:MAG: D-glycero-beta-D-manno-heptose 1-phosphate adenylyltransferase [Campylobacterota bacterium]RLA66823.1 MAG: D-glycero-beta-D-manno-heptose 1-phosphate adenylyltransferase [Campylobacterota bacterium]
MLSEQAQKFLKSAEGKKIVFTNGCFDILHPGHVGYLAAARELGDFLVIGLNSDNSVKKLKGPDRPINNEKNRKFMLEGLKAVDFVEIFDESTPLELIEALSPDILVKGGDWEIKDIVGAEFVQAAGGEVYSLAFKDGHSTTNLIKKLQGKS